MRGMSGIRAAAAVHVMLSLMAWSVAVAHEDDSAAAAAAAAAAGGGGALLAWGLQDQTAAVGRLFELQLPSTENRTAFTVSTSPDLRKHLAIFLYGLKSFKKWIQIISPNFKPLVTIFSKSQIFPG